MKDALQITREDWLTHVEGFLEEHGYNNVAVNTYERVQIGTTGGQVVVINGQRMESPGQQVKIRHIVTLSGDGYVVDADDENCREFTQVCFEVYVNDEKQFIFEHCFYWDEPNEIAKVMNEIKMS